MQTIFQFVADNASKRLAITTKQAPSEDPTLHKLQGMTINQIARLAEEGIDSTATLAYSDPIKLFLKTDIEWLVVIDMIDQALLFNYVKDKLPSLYPEGIRGTIEMAVIYERLIHGDEEDVAEAQELIARIAVKLDQSDSETLNLIRTIWEDGQVNLLWQLFGDAFDDPDESEEDDEEEEEEEE